MAEAFIGVGANLDPARNIRSALSLLADQVRISAISTFYQNPAEGRPEQPDYINGVVAIETDLRPTALKQAVLRRIERELGRERTGDKFAPRPIDLDLLLYGRLPPSPEIERRAFVAIPLAELAPARVIPGASLTAAQLAARFSGAEMKALPNLTRDLRRAGASPIF